MDGKTGVWRNQKSPARDGRHDLTRAVTRSAQPKKSEALLGARASVLRSAASCVVPSGPTGSRDRGSAKPQMSRHGWHEQPPGFSKEILRLRFASRRMTRKLKRQNGNIRTPATQAPGAVALSRGFTNEIILAPGGELSPADQTSAGAGLDQGFDTAKSRTSRLRPGRHASS